jgi:hypothetical protein
LSACELSGYGFRAFATNICGIISPSSNVLLKHIASAYAVLSNRPYSYALNICKRRVNFAIQKGLARQLITSHFFSSSIIEDPFGNASWFLCFSSIICNLIKFNNIE